MPLTCEEVFVDARELYVSFCGARDDQTVDDALRDSLGHRMPQQALHYHRPHVLKQSRLARAREIRERGVLQFRVRRGCETQRFACPAIDRALELRRRVLLCASPDTPDDGDGGGKRKQRRQDISSLRRREEKTESETTRTLMEKSSTELPPATRGPSVVCGRAGEPSSAAMRACNRAICRSCSSSCARCSSTF